MASMPGDRYFAFSFMEAIASKSTAYVWFFGAVVSPRRAVWILVFFDRRNPLGISASGPVVVSNREFLFGPSPFSSAPGEGELWASAGQPNAGSSPSVMAGLHATGSSD